MLKYTKLLYGWLGVRSRQRFISQRNFGFARNMVLIFCVFGPNLVQSWDDGLMLFEDGANSLIKLVRSVSGRSADVNHNKFENIFE